MHLIRSTVITDSERLQLEHSCSPSPFTTSNPVMLSNSGAYFSESQPLSDISDSLPLLLGNCSFISDSGISIVTTLIEEIIRDFPITQDSLDSSITMNTITELEDNKSDAYKLTCLNPETTARDARWERMKELIERRFTYTRKMTPDYSSVPGGK
jgi:hypothetical protein